MTIHDAVRLLLDEYQLEAIEEIVRDDAKQDAEWEGLSGNHPRVLQFRAVCQRLRAFVSEPPA